MNKAREEAKKEVGTKDRLDEIVTIPLDTSAVAAQMKVELANVIPTNVEIEVEAPTTTSTTDVAEDEENPLDEPDPGRLLRVRRSTQAPDFIYSGLFFIRCQM